MIVEWSTTCTGYCIKMKDKISNAFVSEHTLGKGEYGNCQQEKNVNQLPSAISHEVPVSPNEGGISKRNIRTTLQ